MPWLRQENPAFERKPRNDLRSRHDDENGAMWTELIPPGRFCEVRSEALERDQVGQVQTVYEALALPVFDPVRPALEAYRASIADYRKNAYLDLPAPL